MGHFESDLFQARIRAAVMGELFLKMEMYEYNFTTRSVWNVGRCDALAGVWKQRRLCLYITDLKNATILASTQDSNRRICWAFMVCVIKSHNL